MVGCCCCWQRAVGRNRNQMTAGGGRRWTRRRHELCHHLLPAAAASGRARRQVLVGRRGAAGRGQGRRLRVLRDHHDAPAHVGRARGPQRDARRAQRRDALVRVVVAWRMRLSPARLRFGSAFVFYLLSFIFSDAGQFTVMKSIECTSCWMFALLRIRRDKRG